MKIVYLQNQGYMRKMDYVYRIEKNEPRVQKKGQGRKTKREQYANRILGC